MAAIKIRSLEDIVRVYLENLGFGEQKTEAGIRYLIARCNIDRDNVTASLDAALCQTARQVFPEESFNDMQRTALLKLAFILDGGAERWRVEDLFAEKTGDKLTAEMRCRKIVPAPEYQLAEMQPQPIEISKGWMAKIWNKMKK